MKFNTYSIRHGYDGKKCLVHARCCYTPDFMVATAQHLNIEGCDFFSGIRLSLSYDQGKSWSEFAPQPALAPISDGKYITVGCDGTPLYHKKTGKVLLLGHTAEYKEGGDLVPTGKNRKTFYSVFDSEKMEFTKINFLEMPQGFENCGNGSGQSWELENGDLLIPVYYRRKDKNLLSSTVLRCTFDGQEVKMVEMGNSLEAEFGRGVYEPSVICHKGTYYITMRNDECGFVASSQDGLNYSNFQLWKWQDGSLLQNYNTQQHFMIVGDDLYLLYTRRAGTNDHVFRHRAPIFAAKVDNMRLIKDSEVIIVPEKGARLGNFTAAPYLDGKSLVMAAEWMQPKGCESYGSDNHIYLSVCEQ